MKQERFIYSLDLRLFQKMAKQFFLGAVAGVIQLCGIQALVKPFSCSRTRLIVSEDRKTAFLSGMQPDLIT